MTKRNYQCDKLLAALKERPLTTPQIHNLRIMRPGVVVERLREGNSKRKPVRIHTQLISNSRYARYWLWPMWLKALGPK